MDIYNLVWPHGFKFFNAHTKNEALTHMIRHAATNPSVNDAAALEEGILERERIISTGIGLGVALPHAKLPTVKNFFISVGILGNGVDWDATDEQPVRLIFMIVGPDNQQNQYLQILAKLSQIIKNKDLREQIASAKTAEEALKIFAPF